MKNFTLLVCSLLITTSIFAQKYTNTNSEPVTKNWKDLTFTSGNSLMMNLEKADPFSMAAPMFKDELFAEHSMVTVFVMVNSSFSELSDDERSELIGVNWKPYVSYHIIPGRVDSNSIEKAISKLGGTAYFDTLLGQKLGVKKMGADIVLFDEKGNTAKIIASDFYHKNGFFHIVDGLILPSDL